MEKENEMVIDLSDTKPEEPTQQEIEEFKKNVLFSIEKNDETGVVTILPMNEEKNIVLYGEDWVKWFIEQLEDTIRR